MEISGNSFDFDDMFSGSPEQKDGMRGGAGSRTPGQLEMSEPSGNEKLEKSRQSARECRARKKLRYQYLDDMISEREKANLVLREELQKYVNWCHDLDSNQIPAGLQEFLKSDSYEGPVNIIGMQ
ncbi:cAMP-responsive element-binding protein-like 2 [Eurytemora carolleeae]|uniref:cAMP-responsive element-binding protein-like 2 n=1 Tax=Eurytemora carolleeae TaxID=1294199 RepID=UPI000C76FD1A|nr:cAMP-responsive element-binding protein-like 2 [Eurytemora carolleeae]|eukprot:XP_023349579.1 cAMP-responsive element-binding protein-like 2 [Eurytemora affinis]